MPYIQSRGVCNKIEGKLLTVCESSRATEANLQVNEVNESVAESSHQQTALSHHTLDAGTQTEVYLHHSSLQRWNTTSLVNIIQHPSWTSYSIPRERHTAGNIERRKLYISTANAASRSKLLHLREFFGESYTVSVIRSVSEEIPRRMLSRIAIEISLFTKYHWENFCR